MRRGSEQEAAVYCKKEGDYYEVGHSSKGPGTRTDVASFHAALKAGKTDLELMEQDFNAFNKFSRTVDRYRLYVPPTRTEDLVVHLLIGKPGTGKTRTVYEGWPQCYTFPIGKDLWSDGYMGQPEVLVDDFSGQLRLVDTLRFLDRYPIQIPKKHGFNWWCPNVILLTTNIHPQKWYNWEARPEQEEALRRRIHKIWDFDNTWTDGEKQKPTLLNMEDFWVIGKWKANRKDMY